MRIAALEIPDDPIQLCTWLEQELLGLDLGALVAELTAVHGPTSGARASLKEVLGGRLALVLTDGLGALPPAALGQLLTQPRLLLELQELILIEGGPHWQHTNPPPPYLAASLRHGQERLNQFLEVQGQRQEAVAAAPLRPRGGWLRWPGVAGLVAAAAVLVLLVRHGNPPPADALAAWGWNRPGVRAAEGSAGEYLDRLADAAGEWFQARPENAADLAKRISEFREGCSLLIFSRHQPLAERDRQWLVERCRAWAKVLDAQLEALDGGGNPVQVRANVDETASAIVQALRERARRLNARQARQSKPPPVAAAAFLDRTGLADRGPSFVEQFGEVFLCCFLLEGNFSDRCSVRVEQGFLQQRGCLPCVPRYSAAVSWPLCYCPCWPFLSGSGRKARRATRLPRKTMTPP